MESMSPFVHDIDHRSLDKTQTDQEQTKLGFRSNLLQKEGMNYSYTIPKSIIGQKDTLHLSKQCSKFFVRQKPLVMQELC